MRAYKAALLAVSYTHLDVYKRQHFGCDITYDVDYDVGHKTVKFQLICGTVRRMLSMKNKERDSVSNFIR